MKIVKEYINEKFTDESDPIHDMGIGLQHKIIKWIKHINIKSANTHCDGIKHYTINNDGTIDCVGFVALPDDCGNLPDYIQFNEIQGDFIITKCGMTTLKGCPKKVYGEFDCRDNKLISLKYCPSYVERKFLCYHNNKNFSREYILRHCKVANKTL